MKIVRFFPALCLGICLCAGCNVDKGRAVPPQARDPFAQRADPENPPPIEKNTASSEKPVSQMPSAAELGVSLYPHAKPYKDEFGAGAAQIQSEGFVTAILETGDPVEKVVTYYRQALPKAEKSEVTEDSKPVVRLSEPYGGNGMHLVEISAVNSKTRITLQNIRPTKSEVEPSSVLPPSSVPPP